MPAIKSPPGEIKQYQPATFSLDMADDNIATTEWFVNDVSVGTATNTSSLAFAINELGKVKISAKVTLSGCSAVSIPEIEVNVAEAPAPSISGPSITHDQATYSIQNLPPGATVQWSVSNPSIASIDSQGRLVRNNNQRGNIWVTARIQLSSGVIELKTNIQIGFPDFNMCVINAEAFTKQEMYVPEVYYTDPITGLTLYKMVKVMEYPVHPIIGLWNNTLLENNIRYKFIAETPGFYGSYKESFHYIWTYSSLDNNSIVNQPIIYDPNNTYEAENELVKELDEVYIGIIGAPEGIRRIPIKRNRGGEETTPEDPVDDIDDYAVPIPGYIPYGFKFPNTGRYLVNLKVRHGSYISDIYSATVMVVPGNNYRSNSMENNISVSLYPNPATSTVTVELQDNAGDETNKTTTKSVIPKQGQYEVQLWNTSQMLRTYRTSDEKFQLSVNGLPAGIYFVRVVKDGKTHTGKLIKK